MNQTCRKMIDAVPANRRREAEMAYKILLLRQALGYFIADPRFQVCVGGNPGVVEAMIARAKQIYEESAL